MENMNSKMTSQLIFEIFSLRGYLLAVVLYFCTSALVQMVS
jgi:hypothetical protein